jgi:hypothetical protein
MDTVRVTEADILSTLDPHDAAALDEWETWGRRFSTE